MQSGEFSKAAHGENNPTTMPPVVGGRNGIYIIIGGIYPKSVSLCRNLVPIVLIVLYVCIVGTMHTLELPHEAND